MGNTYELKYHRDLSLEMREVRFWGSAVFKQFLLKLLVCYLLLPWRQNCKRKVLLKYALKRLTSCWKLRVFFFNVEFLLVSSVTGIQGWAWPAESHISKSRGWDQALPLILFSLPVQQHMIPWGEDCQQASSSEVSGASWQCTCLGPCAWLWCLTIGSCLQCDIEAGIMN